MFSGTNRMMKRRYLLILIGLFMTFFTQAQNLNLDIGVGLGSTLINGENRAKGEFSFAFLRTQKFGTLGVEFAFGANLNPYGKLDIIEVTSFDLQITDNNYNSIQLLYRYPIATVFSVEPRIGYAELRRFVTTENGQEKLSSSNFSWGLGIVTTIQRLSIVLRYQNMGRTATYEGFYGPTLVQQDKASYSVILLKMSYRIGLDTLFKKKS